MLGVDYTVNTILRHGELEEIVRILLRPYQIRTLPFEALSGKNHGNTCKCFVVDWLQCTPRERLTILKLERMTQVTVIDLSGTLRRGVTRRVFSPPFVWRSMVQEVLNSLAIDRSTQKMDYMVGH